MVRLTGSGTDIAGTNVSVANSSAITATFTLTGVTPGLRNLVITNPDSTSGALAGGFTVVQGGTPQVWVNVIGRNKIRLGSEQTFYIAYGNKGNVDANGLPLTISGIPANASWSLGESIVTPPLPAGVPSIDWSQIPIQLSNGGNIEIPLFIPLVPAGFSGTIPIQLEIPDVETFTLQATTNVSFFQSPLNSAWSSCASSYLKFEMNAVASIPGLNCAATMLLNFASEASDVIDLAKAAPSGAFKTGGQAIYGLVPLGVGAPVEEYHWYRAAERYSYPG